MHRPSRRTILLLPAAAALFLLAGDRGVPWPRAWCSAAFSPGPGIARADAPGRMSMTDWFATHSTRGVAATGAPVDSFLAGNFYFDNNGDGSVTQVDTARIVQGQVIRFKWVAGFHTVTNGTGSGDANAGTLVDLPLTSAGQNFNVQFDQVGTVPFFCRNHELQKMAGVIVVSAPLAVPVGPAAAGSGFTRPAWPNPSGGPTHVGYSLARAGRVRLDVLDVQGRRVATLVDTDSAPGTFDATWDGLASRGGPAPAGVYLARLAWPGGTQTQRLTRVR